MLISLKIKENIHAALTLLVTQKLMFLEPSSSRIWLGTIQNKKKKIRIWLGCRFLPNLGPSLNATANCITS